MKSLDAFLDERAVTPGLREVIRSIAECCKTINAQLQRGELAGILGSAGADNVQGETQKKLDVIANDLLKEALRSER